MAWDSILSFSEGGGVVALLDPSSGMLILLLPEGRHARLDIPIAWPLSGMFIGADTRLRSRW